MFALVFDLVSCYIMYHQLSSVEKMLLVLQYYTGGGEIHIKASKENVSLLHVYRAVKIRSTIALNSTIASRAAAEKKCRPKVIIWASDGSSSSSIPRAKNRQ